MCLKGHHKVGMTHPIVGTMQNHSLPICLAVNVSLSLSLSLTHTHTTNTCISQKHFDNIPCPLDVDIMLGAVQGYPSFKFSTS